MAVGGILLAWPLRPRPARIAWLCLLAAGLTNALVISLLPLNLVNINVVHHYLGAKYPFSYSSFYEVTNAALDRPQVLMRDLEHPPAVLRADPREQRAYYIDLMREAGVAFEPLVPLPLLKARAEMTGVLRDEAKRILAEHLPADEIERFRRDARLALVEEGAERNIEDEGRDITWDYGFNGSPFYALVRQVDPTLHRPFGPGTARLNLAWQIAAALLLVWVAGAALGLEATERVAMAALLFASWDFVGWALPGLIFAGVWLPVALALLAMRRGWAFRAGFAIAWAGLIKLFPLLLLLPAGTRLLGHRRSGRGSRPGAGSAWALRLLAGCALGTVLLGFLALGSGRSWGDFLHKILVQFQSDAYLLNSVSLSQGLLTVGIHDSPVPRVLSALAFLVLAGMFVGGGDEGFRSALPRRSLVLLAAIGWLAHTWFNYYAIIPLLLLPLVAREHRRGAAAAALGMSIAFLLPEFDDPRLLADPVLHGWKLVPYLLIPAWLVVRELRGLGLSRRAKRVAVGLLAASLLVTAGEVLRMRAIRQLDEAGGAALDRGDAGEARSAYHQLIRLDPGNALARMDEAIALAMLGRDAEAARGFARAALQAPEHAATRQNYGRWLLREECWDEANQELEAARELAPCDETTQFDLARVRLGQGREEEAVLLLTRARELRPQNRAVVDLLDSLSP